MARSAPDKYNDGAEVSMSAPIVTKDYTYILNHCARSLARDNSDGRHNYGQYAQDDPIASIAEAWRFPIVDSFFDSQQPTIQADNIVTFIVVNRDGKLGSDISVIGTFSDLITPIPLTRVADSDYWAVTVRVPKGQYHRYKYIAGGRAMTDPINPQRATLRDGSVWSRFFTDYCTDILVLERWECLILERLTSHILPFRSIEGERFLNYYYKYLDRQTKETQFARAYRFDQPVGVVNFIDKLLARQEAHRLKDYKICLAQIDQVLRLRYPMTEPAAMPMTAYIDLYEQLASDDTGRLAGWDGSQYQSPKFFLQLLRRHTYTGAFAHPKYGGNSGAAGWQFLAQNLLDPKTNQLPLVNPLNPAPVYFDWARALEPPLGRNTEYRG
jgi:hypothetical protein